MTPYTYRIEQGDFNQVEPIDERSDRIFLSGRFTKEELRQIIELDGEVNFHSYVNRLGDNPNWSMI